MKYPEPPVINWPPSPKARAHPMAQYATPPIKASRVFFNRMLTVFFVLISGLFLNHHGNAFISYLTDPASRKAKPACMKKIKRDTIIKKN